MSDPNIPSELREFLLSHVKTYEQLEILILLGKAQDSAWTVQNLSKLAKIPVASAQDALRELGEDAVVTPDANCPGAFALSTPDVSRLVAVLARLYEENRLLVMRLMNENALERMRTDAARAFSSAFVIRRKGKDG